MRKILVVSAALLVLSACGNTAIETKKTDNQNFEVEKLFTVDGCNVYRFYDWGSYRYLTTCRGSVGWDEHHGKTMYHESISTASP